MQQFDDGDEAAAKHDEGEEQQDPSHRLVTERAPRRHVGALEHELA